MARDYKREYRTYHKAPLQKKRRASRNAARDLMIRSGAAKKGDGKDVHHKSRNKRGKLNSSRKNLAIQSKSKNRSNNQ